jgi:D-alanyl-D-alanine carboxypeptidase
MALLSPPDFGGWGHPCQGSSQVRVKVDLGASGVFFVTWHRRATKPLLRVAGRWKAWNVQHPGQAYHVTTFGTFSCRDATCCPGKFSNHSWPLAVDINPHQNPYTGNSAPGFHGPHDIPKTVQQFFAAEGWHYLAGFDPMHFERIQIDGEIAAHGGTGPLSVAHAEFVAGPPEEFHPVPWPGGEPIERRKPMMHGDRVLHWQRRMQQRGWRIDDDGWYGDESRRVCLGLQRRHDRPLTGVVDEGLWKLAYTPTTREKGR